MKGGVGVLIHAIHCAEEERVDGPGEGEAGGAQAGALGGGEEAPVPRLGGGKHWRRGVGRGGRGPGK